MTSRRTVLRLAVGACVAPAASWAEVGAPSHLAAARGLDASYHLHGIGTDGTLTFSLPLPARGHAAAAHPSQPFAVAFARRPGTYAIVLDCRDGSVAARLASPPGHHFYGHGAFTSDGAVLLTTENRIDDGQGRIGLWDVASGYRRLGDVASGGIGPHEIIRLPKGDFAVANGGIRTHPDRGREKLNLPTMRPNLSILDETGRISDQMALDPNLHQSSIRHLAVAPDGEIAFAMQWQGDPFDPPPLLGLYRQGGAVRLLTGDADALYRSQGYAGSVAFSNDGGLVGFTAPRGGFSQIFDRRGKTHSVQTAEDICGIASSGTGLIATTGLGEILSLSAAQADRLRTHPLQWDNHLISLVGVGLVAGFSNS